METRHYREMLDIQIANSLDLKYYRHVRERYNAIIEPESIKLPEKPSDPREAISPEGAQVFMMSLARSMRRNLGYGGRRR